MDNRIVVLVPFHNAAEFMKECYDSLIGQRYDNYRLHFLDDYSTDGSLDIIPDGPNIRKYRRNERMFPLKNIHLSLIGPELCVEDIILLVDGDDFLPHSEVFGRINELYNNAGCLMTYGQYRTYAGHQGHCTAYDREEFYQLRMLDYRASHLKTFRYRLFADFLAQDPRLTAYKDESDNFYSMTGDVALMYPLMEIAGYEKVFFNEEVLYIYREHSFNDSNLDRGRQIKNEMHIRSKPGFKQVY